MCTSDAHVSQTFSGRLNWTLAQSFLYVSNDTKMHAYFNKFSWKQPARAFRYIAWPIHWKSEHHWKVPSQSGNQWKCAYIMISWYSRSRARWRSYEDHKRNSKVGFFEFILLSVHSNRKQASRTPRESLTLRFSLPQWNEKMQNKKRPRKGQRVHHI